MVDIIDITIAKHKRESKDVISEYEQQVQITHQLAKQIGRSITDAIEGGLPVIMVAGVMANRLGEVIRVGSKLEEDIDIQKVLDIIIRKANLNDS